MGHRHSKMATKKRIYPNWDDWFENIYHLATLLKNDLGA
jgi:hypothetical protein